MLRVLGRIEGDTPWGNIAGFLRRLVVERWPGLPRAARWASGGKYGHDPRS